MFCLGGACFACVLHDIRVPLAVATWLKSESRLRLEGKSSAPCRGPVARGTTRETSLFPFPSPSKLSAISFGIYHSIHYIHPFYNSATAGLRSLIPEGVGTRVVFRR